MQHFCHYAANSECKNKDEAHQLMQHFCQYAATSECKNKDEAHAGFLTICSNFRM